MASSTQARLAQVDAPRPSSGAELFADVETFAALGVHRYGTDGDVRTTDWIAEDLRNSGLDVSFQHFTLRKQYFLDEAHIEIAGARIEAMPFWWLPEDKASFTLTAPLAADDASASGRILRLTLPFDRASYLDNSHRDAVRAAAARGPAAILLTIENPSDEIYVYNVGQQDTPWSVPVVVVAAKDAAALDSAQASGAPVTIAVRGRYAQDVAGRNVIGRIDRGAASSIVVSTPMTGWFGCVGERAPGIAGFLAMARQAVRHRADVNFVFVATAGHEVGHGGMEVFLHEGAPKPDATLLWIHFGASIACFQWRREHGAWVTDRVVDPRRLLVSSPSADALTKEAFDALPLTRFLADKEAPGELREVKAAGYRNFFGMAGRHHFFHNPADSVATTGPEALEAIMRGFDRALAKTLAERERAFG